MTERPTARIAADMREREGVAKTLWRLCLRGLRNIKLGTLAWRQTGATGEREEKIRTMMAPRLAAPIFGSWAVRFGEEPSF